MPFLHTTTTFICVLFFLSLTLALLLFQTHSFFVHFIVVPMLWKILTRRALIVKRYSNYKKLFQLKFQPFFISMDPEMRPGASAHIHTFNSFCSICISHVAVEISFFSFSVRFFLSLSFSFYSMFVECLSLCLDNCPLEIFEKREKIVL